MSCCTFWRVSAHFVWLFSQWNLESTFFLSTSQMKNNGMARRKFRFSISIISNWFCLHLRTATTSGTWPTPTVLISASNCFSKLNNVEQFASHRETVAHIKRAQRLAGGRIRRPEKVNNRPKLEAHFICSRWGRRWSWATSCLWHKTTETLSALRDGFPVGWL